MTPPWPSYQTSFGEQGRSGRLCSGIASQASHSSERVSGNQLDGLPKPVQNCSILTSSVQAFCLNAASIPNRGSCCCSCAASAAVVCVSSVHPPNRAVMRRRRDRDRVMNALLCNLQELKVMPSQLRPGPGPLGGGGMAQPLQPF